MACPYFIPTEKFAEGEWPHRQRLPLGNGWRGLCTAAGDAQVVPSDDDLLRYCNLGYAAHCGRIPAERRFDAARFSVARHRDQRIDLCYVLECGHRPGSHGMLAYDAGAGRWIAAHPDPRIQAMAACYLESYFERHPNSRAAGVPAPRDSA
jgi:hypothetical protein